MALRPRVPPGLRFSQCMPTRAVVTTLPRRSVALRPSLSAGLPLVDASNEDLSRRTTRRNLQIMV